MGNKTAGFLHVPEFYPLTITNVTPSQFFAAAVERTTDWVHQQLQAKAKMQVNAHQAKDKHNCTQKS